MQGRLNHLYPSLIVRRMNKILIVAAVLLAFAAPSFAQLSNSEFGFLLGGSKRLSSSGDVANGIDVKDRFTFSNSVKEAYYSVEIDPSTRFNIKLGRITAPGAFRVFTPDPADPSQQIKTRTDVAKADVDHIDAIIDYRFSEPFGSSGLFAGVGLYRQSASGFTSETNYGLQVGVNADFPMSRKYGFVAEAAYHAVNYHYRPRYVTLSGGLRISF
jgi:hypothetical protein